MLVDNSPHDGAAQALLEVAPGATMISNPRNVGFAAAVNQGIRAGTADLVLLLNPDVSTLRGRYADIVALFEAEQRLGAVAPRLRDADGSLQRGCRRRPTWFDLVSENLDLASKLPSWGRPRRFQMLDWDYADTRHVDSATGACLFLRRAALEDVGLLDERFFFYWEETDWFVRAQARGWQALHLTAVEATHATSTSSGIRYDDMGLLLVESQYIYVRKHFGITAELALRSSLGLYDAARYASTFAARGDGAARREHVRKRIAIHLLSRTPGREAALRRSGPGAAAA